MMNQKEATSRLQRGLLILGLILVTVPAQLTSISRQTSAGDSEKQSHFSTQEFLEPIKILTSDELKGRGNGTPELDRAAKYVAVRFHKFKLKPAGDNGRYLQHFSLVVGAKLGPKNVAATVSGSTAALLVGLDSSHNPSV